MTILGALLALVACEPVPTGPTSEEVEQRRLARGAEIVAACAASECQRLDLDGAMLADYTVLNELTHVRALMVSYSNFDDLGDIAGMTQLVELHIGQTGVEDLSGLRGFTNLRLLHAQGLRNVQDFTPIHQMTGLRELAVDVNEETGIGYIANLRQLETLSFMSGTITDLAPLSGHRSLQVLNIEAGVPEDTSALLNIPRLREITLNFWAVDDETRAALERNGVTVLAIPVEIVC